MLAIAGVLEHEFMLLSRPEIHMTFFFFWQSLPRSAEFPSARAFTPPTPLETDA
jgi:hypothetical protein